MKKIKGDPVEGPLAIAKRVLLVRYPLHTHMTGYRDMYTAGRWWHSLCEHALFDVVFREYLRTCNGDGSS